MNRLMRLIQNRETWELAGAMSSLTLLVVASAADFQNLQNLAALLSGVSAALQLSTDIRRRRAERQPELPAAGAPEGQPRT
ncbi:hypothetical protein [Actinoplanes rectilineatus]|uniref:hypothetical protein n=1 Tax=Actinoplanes rectilineatus TaxID=113571 RepID=UPI0012F7A058|nr:hypothetical protein [Actinoplanes rectilineatus]